MPSCECLTLKGTRCKRKPTAGSKYCYQHQNCAVKATTATTTATTTAATNTTTTATTKKRGKKSSKKITIRPASKDLLDLADEDVVVHHPDGSTSYIMNANGLTLYDMLQRSPDRISFLTTSDQLDEWDLWNSMTDSQRDQVKDLVKKHSFVEIYSPL